MNDFRRINENREAKSETILCNEGNKGGRELATPPPFTPAVPFS